MAKKDSNETNGLRNRTHNSVDHIMDKAENMKKHGMETANNMKVKAIKIKDGVNGYIKRNPKKTVMYVAGAGFVAGAVTTAALMRRKCKEEKESIET